MSAVAAVPAGPRGPMAWQNARYLLDPIGYVEACAARYGPVFTLRMHFFGTFVAAIEPRDVRTILAAVPDRFPDSQASPLTPLMGEAAMMFATGATHRRQRRALRPAFHGDLAERWAERIAAVAQAELARLPREEPVALLPAMRRIALEVVCRLAFGASEPERYVRLRAEVGRRQDPRLALMFAWPTLWSRGGRLNPGAPLKRWRDAMNREIYAEIARRRLASPSDAHDMPDAHDLPDAPGAADALALLLAARDEHGAPLPDAEIRDQLLGLVLAGHETAASALASAVERLSRTPHAARRLREELAAGDSVGDSGGGVTYLDAVVHETLRVRPSFMDAPRTTTRELELSGRPIPPGTCVSAMFAIAQRSPETWDDPLAFKPERFLTGDPAPYAFTPFGGGPRRCVAASFTTLLMRVVVETFVRSVQLAPASGREETLRLNGNMLVPSRGARVVLRDHSARSSSRSGGRVASQLG